MKLYKFNKNTLQYQRVRKRRIISRAVWMTFIFAVLLINTAYILITTPREQVLIQQNTELVKNYEYLNLKLNHGFKELYKLQEKDAYLYHNVILNNPSHGQGGMDVDIDSTDRNEYFQFKVDEFLNQIERHDASLSLTTNRIEKISNMPLMMPLKTSEYSIPSRYGLRYHPILKTVKLHSGIDFGVKEGIPVYATAHGIVRFVQSSEKGYGNQIYIDHEDYVSTRYAHLDSMFVQKGDTVHRGFKIGTTGNTGLSTGPHLHYEVMIMDIPQNPEPYLIYDELYSKKLVENLVN